MLILVAIMFCGGTGADGALSRFVRWATLEAYNCGLPSIPVTVVPNLVFCNHGSSAVFAMHTSFEGTAHSFGITACDDNHIYIGLRIENQTRDDVLESVLVYMEFLQFEDFLSFFSRCVFIPLFARSTAKQN